MTALLLGVAASKLALSVVLAVAIIAVQRRCRPVAAHTLWLLVLLVLVIPAVFSLPVAGLPGVSSVGRLAGDADGVGPRAVGALLGSSPGPGTGALSRALVGIWLTGSACLLLWSLVRAHRFDRLLRTASEPALRLQSVAEGVGREIGLSAIPTVVATRARLSPLVWWTGGRVRVVIPASVLRAVERSELRWIVAHELAHVRRRDHWVRWLEWLACVAFWWNPVAWLARRRLREAEEMCCDELVLRSLNADARRYAGSLLTVMDVLSAGPGLRAPALASGADGGGRTRAIERRLKMIIGGPAISKTPRRIRVALGLCALAVLPLGLAYCGTDGTEPAIVSPETGAAVINESAVTSSRPDAANVQATTTRGVVRKIDESSLTEEQRAALAKKRFRAQEEVELREVRSRKNQSVLLKRVSEGEEASTSLDPAALERFEKAGRKIREAMQSGQITPAEGRKKLAELEYAMALEARRQQETKR